MDHIEYLGVADVAEAAEVHENTVRYWVFTGKLVADAKVGRTVGFHPTTVARFLAERAGAVSSPTLDGTPTADEAAA